MKSLQPKPRTGSGVARAGAVAQLMVGLLCAFGVARAIFHPHSTVFTDAGDLSVALAAVALVWWLALYARARRRPGA